MDLTDDVKVLSAGSYTDRWQHSQPSTEDIRYRNGHRLTSTELAVKAMFYIDLGITEQRTLNQVTSLIHPAVCAPRPITNKCTKLKVSTAVQDIRLRIIWLRTNLFRAPAVSRAVYTRLTHFLINNKIASATVT